MVLNKSFGMNCQENSDKHYYLYIPFGRIPTDRARTFVGLAFQLDLRLETSWLNALFDSKSIAYECRTMFVLCMCLWTLQRFRYSCDPSKGLEAFECTKIHRFSKGGGASLACCFLSQLVIATR